MATCRNSLQWNCFLKQAVAQLVDLIAIGGDGANIALQLIPTSKIREKS
jgi:hypothetical protein